MTRHYRCFLKMVGTAGFEPATSWSRTKRTTKLCYVPCVFQAPDKYSTFSEKIKERHLICGT